MRISLGFLAVCGLLLLGARIALQEPPADPSAAPEITMQPLATGLGSVTSIVHAGDSRLFLTVQTGRILVWNGSQILPAPFLDLSSLVSCCGERGLLSVAFHPRYAQNGFLFVYYTDRAGGIVIARYSVLAGSPNTVDPGSGVILLTIPHPNNANHNGGELQFGPDGYLYIGTGDGGSANDPPCNAQRDNVLLGKLLRIDVDTGGPPFYRIPPTNPFVGRADALEEIWAKGLRNPWRFSFDRSTGDLWIADVGQSAREEIDFQPRSSPGGENYGWKIMEGTLCGVGGNSGCPAGVSPCNSPSFQYPVFEYGHSGSGCTGSVTGGYLYRGALIPQLQGLYVYGDYCSGRIWASGQLLAPTAPGLSTFGEDMSAELYLGTERGGFFRIVNPNPVTATPTRMALARTVTPRPPPRVVTRPGL